MNHHQQKLGDLKAAIAPHLIRIPGIDFLFQGCSSVTEPSQAMSDQQESV